MTPVRFIVTTHDDRVRRVFRSCDAYLTWHCANRVDHEVVLLRTAR